MKTRFVTIAAATLALAGCNLLASGGGASEENKAEANESAGNASRAAEEPEESLGRSDRAEDQRTGAREVGRSTARGPIDGRWRVRFVASDVVYAGEFVAEGDEGDLTIGYRSEGEDRLVRQRCSIAGGREIAVRCRDPRMLRGEGEYAADNFFLEEIDSSTLRGAISSQPGERGTVTFTRR